MKTMSVLLSLLISSSAVNAQTLNFKAAAEYSRVKRGQAVLVLQNGKEVFGEAQNRFDLNSQHILASGSKSFACGIAVAAQDDGLLKLDEPVSQTLPEWHVPGKSTVTIRQLLSFTSGLAGNLANPEDVPNSPNLNLTAVNWPLSSVPGERYSYSNTHLAVFNEIIKRKTGGLTDTYLMRRILAPIGVTAITWTRDLAGNAQIAGGAKMTARDWARYGQLVLQGGAWNGKRILSAEGLQQCLRGSDALSIYGLTWWLNASIGDTLDSFDIIPVRGFGLPNLNGFERFSLTAPSDLFMAAGAYNQRLYIVPSLQLVIVRFGFGGEWLDEDFLRALLR
jgi:CubicO group peptidase (beta-lactamase class C family)